MKIFSIKTHKIRPGGKQNLFEILDKYLKTIRERSIVVITSKIVSICQGRVVKIEKADKKELIRQEAEYFLPPEESKYNITLTMKGNLLLPTAGVDESNGAGYFILWPENPQETANQVRKYLGNRFSVKKVGVIITDSKTTPLRRGTTGVAIAHSGFAALNNYIGKRDIFGRKLKVTKANVLDALAVSAVLVMGEGAEQTPMAVIEDIPFVRFQNRNPSKKELKDFRINMEDDLYGPLLKSIKWQKGGKKAPKVVVGGTFEVLHRGHKVLLKKAFSLGEVMIGLTSNRFAQKLKKRKVKDFQKRKKQLVDFIKKEFKVTPEIVKIEDKFGFTLKEDFDYIVVSPETYKTALLINQERRKRNKKPIKIVKIDFVLDKDGKLFSSTKILKNIKEK